MKIRATLIELWKKVTPFKESDNVYWNGVNNDYSEEIERVVSNSPSGSRAREMFSKFIYGSGIDEKLNPTFEDGVLLSEVVKDVIDDVVVQNGAFIHTTYGLEVVDDNIIFLPKQPKSLIYHNCRISNQDDDGHDGMILYKIYNKNEASVTKKEKKIKKKYYPFNKNQEVIKAQINADAKEAGYIGDDWSEKIKYYRGQVMYLNLTPKFRYAVSKFDSVFNDLDTEYRISVYFNGGSRGGFLGKLAVLTQGLDEETSEKLKQDMSQWLGAEGSSDIYHLDVESVENLDNVMKLINVPSQFNDKQFSVVSPHIRRNILGAANNLPEGLAFANEGALFAGSGESYIQMKKFYWEQCEWDRQKVEDAFWKLGFTINFQPFKNETDGNIVNPE